MRITHLYLRFVLNKETIQKRKRERGRDKEKKGKTDKEIESATKKLRMSK